MTVIQASTDVRVAAQPQPGRAAAPSHRLRQLLNETFDLPVSAADPAAALPNVRRPKCADWLVATEDDPHHPSRVFDQLRWGGRFFFASHRPRQTEALSRLFNRKGFALETPVTMSRRRWLGLPLGRRWFYFVARKVTMVPPGEYSDRFTYDVRLERRGSGFTDADYVVVKQVPTLDDLRRRLTRRTGGSGGAGGDGPALIDKHARQLFQTIFPVFLTRESAFLKIIHRDLPEPYRSRVPQLLRMEKDDRGYVRRLELNWMTRAREPIGQLEFATQAAQLLQQLHERARVIHLDLRLDNFVITDAGVGFLDYGSAARVGENLGASPLLSNLFTHIMRTSQIQRMLDHMSHTGAVTNELMTNSRQKVDKAIDLFYLAVQIERPDTNPYTRDLVRYQHGSEEARLIAELCQQILRPADPKRPPYGSARQVLAGLEEIKRRLG